METNRKKKNGIYFGMGPHPAETAPA